MTNGDKLNALFRALRRSNLVARQNHLCCGGCAAASIGEMARARGLRGGVYYHRQDGERLRPGRTSWTRKPAEEVLLGFGSVDADESVTIEIGAEVCRLAEQVGLATEWSGSSAERVTVLLPGGIDAETVPSIAQLREAAQKADDAFTSALVAEYGKARAGDARYWHDSAHSFSTRVLARAKEAADRRVEQAIEAARTGS